MPLYQYQCLQCQVITEELQSIKKDIPATIQCSVCKGIAIKIISPNTFILKGEGWFKDGYTKKSDGEK